MTIKDRAFNALNLKQYSKLNKLDNVGYLTLDSPKQEQYILRMLIKRMFGQYQIPEEYQWIKPLVDLSEQYQQSMGIYQPFVYLTIRKGIVKSTTDDLWHVDGFSKTITHLPEQNYIWVDKIPTEYVEKQIDFPSDFDPLKHNIHSFFQNRIFSNEILTMKGNTVYCLDPYIIHKRPTIDSNVDRIFIRLSFTPIEIEDVNNTLNPLLLTNYNRDGIKDVRNKLVDYDLSKI